MNQIGLTYHHLGLAVREPAPAQAFLAGLHYQLARPVFDPEQNVNLMMATHATMPTVEIIWPSEGVSPVSGIVARHPKGLVYHVCYIAECLSKSLDALKKAQLEPVCVSPPKPAILFGLRPVSFYVINGIGLIEIIEGPLAPA